MKKIYLFIILSIASFSALSDEPKPTSNFWCEELKVGQSMIVDMSYANSKSKIPLKYSLKRTEDSSWTAS